MTAVPFAHALMLAGPEPASLVTRARHSLQRTMVDLAITALETSTLRPLVTASTVLAAELRLAVFRPAFASVMRPLNVAFFRALGSDDFRAHVERHTEQMVDDARQAGFAEETVERIEYVLFAAARTLASVLHRVEQGPPLALEPSQLIRVAWAANEVELLQATLAYAVLHPQLVRNPRVIDMLAERGTAAADHYIASLARVGFEL